MKSWCAAPSPTSACATNWSQTEGGFTRHLPTNTEMSIFDASEKYRADGNAARHSCGQRVRLRVVPRLGRERPGPARRPRRDRRKLRAHPPLEPGRHGHSPAAVPRRRERRLAEADRRRNLRDHRHPRTGRTLRRRKPGESARHCERQGSQWSSKRWSASTRRRKRSTTPTAGFCSTC